jgi:hypothetical protein
MPLKILKLLDICEREKIETPHLFFLTDVKTFAKFY